MAWLLLVAKLSHPRTGPFSNPVYQECVSVGIHGVENSNLALETSKTQSKSENLQEFQSQYVEEKITPYPGDTGVG